MRTQSSIGLAVISLAMSADAAGPFVEVDGIVHFGVEESPPASGWNQGTGIAGYIGKSYYAAGKDSDNGGAGTLSYTIQIKNAGNYQILVRNRISGGNTTEQNDSFLSASGSPIAGEWAIGTNQWYKIYCNKANQWMWETSNKDHDPKAIRQRFSAGTHTVKLSLRSAGHILDHVIVYDYERYPDFAAATGKQPRNDKLDEIAKGKSSSVPRLDANPVESRVGASGGIQAFPRPGEWFRLDGRMERYPQGSQALQLLPRVHFQEKGDGR